MGINSEIRTEPLNIFFVSLEARYVTHACRRALEWARAYARTYDSYTWREWSFVTFFLSVACSFLTSRLRESEVEIYSKQT